MSDWLVVIILGIVEGITEFIPISSTGHLLITEHFLHTHKSELFNVVIQCGAVLAVLPLFSTRLKAVFFHWHEPENKDYILKLLTAFFITGVGGVILQKLNFKLPEEPTPVALALLVGGILFLAVEAWLKKGKPHQDRITWSIAVAVGLAQLVAAVFPGASRSGTTILIALMLGLSRPLATEFSFLVGIPTLLSAGALKIYKQLHHGTVAENWSQVIVGSVVAALVSFVVVKWLLRYVQRHSFVLFGWYRIAFGILLLFLLR